MKNRQNFKCIFTSIVLCLTLTSCLEEEPFQSYRPLLSVEKAEQFLNPEEIGYWFSYQPEAITLTSIDKMLPQFDIDKNKSLKKNWDDYEDKHFERAQYYRNNVTQHYLDKYGAFYESFLNPFSVAYLWAWKENPAVKELNEAKKQFKKPIKEYPAGTIEFNDFIRDIKSELKNEASFSDSVYDELKQLGELPDVFKQAPSGTLLQYIGNNKYNFTIPGTKKANNELHLIAVPHASSGMLTKNYILQVSDFDPSKNEYTKADYLFISKKRFGDWKIWLQDKAAAKTLWQSRKFKNETELMVFAKQVFNGIGFYNKNLSIIPLERNDVLFYRKLSETTYTTMERLERELKKKNN